MANYNRVILIGNLTRDPQLSYLPSQTAVVDFGLAVNRRWKGPDNQQREETCFIDCRAYGRQAEVFNQYMAKGRAVLVEGRLTFDTWEGKDGSKRSKHRVTVERFQFLGQPGAGPGPGAPPRQRAAAPHAAPPQGSPPPSEPAEPPPEAGPPPSYEEEGGGEDIPF